jgi:hypothetical protein
MAAAALYVHQQQASGDHHVYAARSWFLPDATPLFDCTLAATEAPIFDRDGGAADRCRRRARCGGDAAKPCSDRWISRDQCRGGNQVGMEVVVPKVRQA